MSVVGILMCVILVLLASPAEAITESQLEGMAVTQPFNASSSSKSSYSTNWSKLEWASSKGTETERGWEPSGYPNVSGTFDKATVTDVGSGIAALVRMTASPGNAERYFSLWLDEAGASATRTGYELRYTQTLGDPELTLSKWESGKQTKLGSTSISQFGGLLALVDLGETVSAWAVNGEEAKFTELLSKKDSTFASGNAGLEGSGEFTRLDDFRVGALLTPVESTPEALENLALVDSFGTNESPLSGGGKWAALNWDSSTSGHNTGRVSSGWGPFDAYPTINGAFWNKATFADTGAGTAVLGTLIKSPENLSRYFSLWIDMPSPASARSGYELRLTETSTGVYEASLSKWESGSKTVLTSKGSYALPTNRPFALVDREGIVSAWANPFKEGWEQILSAKDSTFSSGYIGLEGSGNITRITEFKGGQMPPLKLPVNVSRPAITPTTPLQAVSLSTSNGTWTNSPTSYAYQWLRCTGGECTNIGGATGAKYTPTELDVGYSLAVDVTASNSSGNGVARTALTSAVQKAGTITEYTVPSKEDPWGIASGPDGNLWFTAATKIGYISTAGSFTEFSLPKGQLADLIVKGPEGRLWYTINSSTSGIIGKINSEGEIIEYELAKWPSTSTVGIALGPDGNLWFSGIKPVNQVGKITTSGTVTEYGVPEGAYPYYFASGPDGNIWFTLPSVTGSRIGKVTTSGGFTEYSSAAGNDALAITKGPDGNLWFTNLSSGKIGKITTTGTRTEYSLPAGSKPWGITEGADGNLWFTVRGTSKIGRITTGGTITEYSLPAGSEPLVITQGPDQKLWFTVGGTHKIGNIVP